MISRRNRIQEKKTTRKGIYFLLASLVLLAILVIFGVQLILQGTNLLSQFKAPQKVVTNDNTPPGPPQIDPIPPVATNVSPLTLNGRAEANSTVKVYLNDQKIKEIPVNDSSRFVFDIPLNQGDNNLYLTTTDQAGNTSPQSTVYDITFDNTPPSLDISKPHDGDSFYSPNQTISVEGKTDPEAQITVNDRLAIVNNDGSFSIKIKLDNGDNTLHIAVKDKAGNETDQDLKVTYNQ